MYSRSQINPFFLILIAMLVFSSFRSGQFSDPIQWILNELYILPGVIIGLSFHEFAHAWTAYKLHDPTPKMQGRVTINPLAHVDLLGFVALLFCGFGWGKPVEINPNNFRHRRRDDIMVSAAGVVMNLIIAIVFGFVAKLMVTVCDVNALNGTGMVHIVWQMVIYVIMINLVLMIFNLIPVPPLDGFQIIGELFTLKTTNIYWTLYQYGSLILLGLIIFNITDLIITPGVNAIFGLIYNFIIL